MNKRTKTDRELLLDASLEFIMNSPEEVFDQYLKEAGEDGSELERRATHAIGAALARHESAAAECPGEWEPGCDLGANEAHAKVHEPQEPVAWMVYTEGGKSAYVTDNPTDLVGAYRALPLYTR